MRRAVFLLFLLSTLTLASGLDLALGLRRPGEGSFTSFVGADLDLGGLALRGGLRFGVPEGMVLEGLGLYYLPVPILTPYLGGGAAFGLSQRTGDGYRLAPGAINYLVGVLGLALPERGYRPYLEAAYYLGGRGDFVRYSVGFAMEVF